MTLTLPYPPTTNHAYTVARGRKIKTKTAREYHEAVQGQCFHAKLKRTAINGNWTKATRFTVTIVVHPPDRRKRDLANTEKLAVDAVFDYLDLDDAQIDELRLVRDEVQAGGLLIMSIQEATS